MAEVGTVFKLSPLPRIETPEALYLGMGPTEAQMRQGPLTVSALGADPPERSTHFHLSLMSLVEGKVETPKVIPSGEELRLISDLLPSLNTKVLTIVAGRELDHGLVWEGLGDLHTYSSSEAEGKPMREVLPEGDAEVALRRFIDDSVNLLFEQEFNLERIDEGLPPFNLLLPWGQGKRLAVPNLALRRGEPALVTSESLRMAGLVRLAGYRHEDRFRFGRGLNLKMSDLAGFALSNTLVLALIGGPSELRARGLSEELEWFAARLDKELLAPLLAGVLKGPARVALICPRVEGPGLGLTIEHGDVGQNVVPFDERALEERRLSTIDVATAVARGLEN
jgi:2,3-bisphosphoglycerate-independent phosphoglycerate mutase